MKFKDKFEAYNKLKDELIGQEYIVEDSKEIQFGLQFIVIKDDVQDLIRIYSSDKKGIKIDLSQVKNQNLKKEIQSFIGEESKQDIKELKSIKKESIYYSLCIGINEFSEPNFASLKYAENDAEELHTLFVHKFGIGEGTIKLLSKDATRAKITAALNKLKKIVRPQDSVIIFIASHGDFSVSSKEDPGYYLICHDTEDKNLIGTALPMSMIKNMLSDIKAEKKVIFMDTCYSGGISILSDISIYTNSV